MSERVLFVDDEPNILEAIRRQIGQKVALDTATSGVAGLRLVEQNGPYALVISDMRMPQMNGANFLARVRELAPDTVRMIFSGQADMQATIDAVNDGQIFRFLTKPCPPEQLWKIVESGLKQYRLINAERDLLEQTLSGAVKTLHDLLGLTNPTAYRRATRIQRYAQAIAEALKVGDNWQLRLAMMLSQVGCITLPAGLLERVCDRAQLTTEERRLYDSHPEVAARLLGAIPRLEPVADIVLGQTARPSLAGQPPIPSRWPGRTLGIMVLRAALELDELIVGEVTPELALRRLVESWPELPPAIADAIRRARITSCEKVVRTIGAAELAPGMILDEDLKSRNGIRLVPQGHEVTDTVMMRLRNVAAGVGLREPFRVRVPG